MCVAFDAQGLAEDEDGEEDEAELDRVIELMAVMNTGGDDDDESLKEFKVVLCLYSCVRCGGVCCTCFFHLCFVGRVCFHHSPYASCVGFGQSLPNQHACIIKKATDN